MAFPEDAKERGAAVPVAEEANFVLADAKEQAALQVAIAVVLAVETERVSPAVAVAKELAVRSAEESLLAQEQVVTEAVLPVGKGQAGFQEHFLARADYWARFAE